MYALSSGSSKESSDVNFPVLYIYFYFLGLSLFKCYNCFYKYSFIKFRDDLKILHYFSLEIPVYKTAKDLEFCYKKVRRKYMQYRD